MNQDIESFQRSIQYDFENLHCDFPTAVCSLIAEFAELEDAVMSHNSKEVLLELGDCFCYLVISLNLSGFQIPSIISESRNSCLKFSTIGCVSEAAQKRNRPNYSLCQNSRLLTTFQEMLSYLLHVSEDFGFSTSMILETNLRKIQHRKDIGYGVYD
jgi:NTP pyrophosphatase (non-canonical NTP hydrolase)